MPFRPPPCLSGPRTLHPPPPHAPAHTHPRCYLAHQTSPPRYHGLPHASPFHTTPRTLTSTPSAPTHYETLSLPATATPSDIKRQFFTLSKRHHPDKNPSDPTASTRFVQISEAYHVLSVPEKRAQYDEQLHSASRRSRWGAGGGGEGGGSSRHPQGSYSSASYAGSRPATGLNKKRSTFQGPPPSFYNSGGYGRHGAKRGEYAHHHHHPHANADPAAAETEHGQESGAFDGFGPGQTSQGSEVPHFDGHRHKQTHDHVNEHIYARRRSRRRNDIPEDIDRGGTLINFLLVSGAVGMIGLSAKLMGDKSEGTVKKKDNTP
ncbi:DnaJ-domain-containing protein [Melanomma pulvis-pyrius CBS 109.77]|uniref:DnaJ-domain-containing protein n=1 Tax=Melanomma pulvis-pyrius CBS 109.77 TaxID=1314802 RepID=A0A6A6XXR4_9PLEO|nr:DnaJ-domain-containing protein [Melanomma pulvis-pyrius CBS 109.77]